MPENVAHSVGGKIFTFGSFRLGVHTKGKLPFHFQSEIIKNVYIMYTHTYIYVCSLYDWCKIKLREHSKSRHI